MKIHFRPASRTPLVTPLLHKCITNKSCKRHAPQPDQRPFLGGDMPTTGIMSIMQRNKISNESWSTHLTLDLAMHMCEHLHDAKLNVDIQNKTHRSCRACYPGRAIYYN